MNPYAIRSALLGSVGLALALASGAALAATYRLTDLGTLGGDYSEGYDLNDSGQVTGVAYTAGHEGHAFLWDGTRMQNLGTLLGGTESFGFAINASGQVAGDVVRRDGSTHAFLWDRPEIIKSYSVVGALKRAHVPQVIFHTNQHSSPGMRDQIYAQMSLR